MGLRLSRVPRYGPTIRDDRNSSKIPDKLVCALHNRCSASSGASCQAKTPFLMICSRSGESSPTILGQGMQLQR